MQIGCSGIELRLNHLEETAGEALLFLMCKNAKKNCKLTRRWRTGSRRQLAST